MAQQPTSASAVVLTREERDRCWKARDAYHACLDANGQADACMVDDDCGQLWCTVG
jgi:hypothetical protein